LIPSPIHKVLSSIQQNRVRALLMGGQACVFYGAAEFSRDTDFALTATPGNLKRLRAALSDLQAEVIAVPPFEEKFLEAGHAVHFRCRAPGAAGLRIDVMTRMRGVDAFPKLWARRTVLELEDGTVCNLLSLPDLVRAKKTQRNKDWPMLSRLVEASYFENQAAPGKALVNFWLRELRTPELLASLARRFPGLLERAAKQRPLLEHAASGDLAALESALRAEEEAERAADREYWRPLKKELESLRHAARPRGQSRKD
jgi:hypothetical protein